MTSFVYRCLRHHTFDSLHPIGEAPPSVKCPECGGDAYKVVTAPAVHFHGEGFTKTAKETP
jgi:putative FmdB family regulatory protein